MKEEKTKSINLWEAVGNGCLQQALQLLDTKEIPTAETVGMIEGLVQIAIAIDGLNLRWAEQNRWQSSLAAGQDRPSLSREAKN